MKQLEKGLSNKPEVNSVLNFGDKNREKYKKLQTFDLSYFVGKIYFEWQCKELYSILACL